MGLNPVFWLLIVLGLVGVWFGSRNRFKDIGKLVLDALKELTEPEDN